MHIVAQTYSGGVYSWGARDYGWLALGHGTSSGSGAANYCIPRRIEALRGVRVHCISAGVFTSCAVTAMKGM
jgi:hypothetical protein